MFTQPHDVCEWAHYCTGMEDGRYPIDESKLPPIPATLSTHPVAPEAHRARQRQAKGNQTQWTEAQWRIYQWGYYRMVEMVDCEIGRLLDALDDTGLAENTLVVFCSDHGEGLGELGMITKNFLYDSAARVPLTFRLPGTIPAGQVVDRFPVSLLDLVPTLCDYASIAPPPGMKGVSLRQFLEKGEVPERPFVGMQCLGGRGYAIRSQRFKYIRYREDPVDQFFDMQADPGETRNLAAAKQCPEELDQHRKWMAEWLGTLDIAECVPPEYRPDYPDFG
jgi:arylsulfatase A-like enzyme